MNIKWKALVVSVAIPVASYFLIGFISSNSAMLFNGFVKPPLSPPSWLFPIVWIVLYTMMGLACYFIYTADAEKREKKRALLLYGMQLGVNFFWSSIFFNLSLYLVALIWLVVLWILVALTIAKMFKISGLAACLMLPYLVWLTFAGYLNVGIALLN